MKTLQPASNFYLERVGFETKVNMRRNLKNGDNIVGREGVADVDINVKSSQCSAKHCMIMVSEDLVVVKNLNTSNGTSVNGTKIVKDKMAKVVENDLIGIVDGFKHHSELIGNFNYVIYRLCKYSNDNLPTIEIDDDVIIEIKDDSDNEAVADASNTDESVNTNKGLDAGMQLSENFNIQISISSSIDTAKAGSSKDIRWEDASDVNGANDSVCFVPPSSKENDVSSDEVSNGSCISSTAIEVNEGTKEMNNNSTDPNVNMRDKLKETVTKLIYKAKKKREPELIVARPIQARRKTKFEDQSTPSSRKPQTQYLTKEERNERLRKLATKKTNLVENREKRRPTVKAKVTVNNRGSFLTDASQIPILPGQRKLINKKSSDK